MTNVQLLCSGYCAGRQALLTKASLWKKCLLPVNVGLVSCNDGSFGLFDAGLCSQMNQMLKSSLTGVFYSLVAHPTVQKGQSLKEQLIKRGITPSQIAWIFLSHIHPDHYFGLADFPSSRIICHEEIAKLIRKGTPNFWIPKSFPDFAIEKLESLDDSQQIDLPSDLSPFDRGWDLFGDQEIFIVPLPGHCPGHCGLAICKKKRWAFLTGDATFGHPGYQKEYVPPFLLRWFFYPDLKQTKNTLKKLHKLQQCNPLVSFFPTHAEAIDENI